jgi:hypothetical protein
MVMFSTDENRVHRLKFYQEYTKKATGIALLTDKAEDFDKMSQETKPDTVIVTKTLVQHTCYFFSASKRTFPGKLLRHSGGMWMRLR